MWTQAQEGLEWTPGKGNYGFSVASDPQNSDEVLLGTIGGGLFRSIDRGQTFTRVEGPFLATDSLGIAVDPRNADHVVVSSTEGYSGTPGVYETSDGGQNWRVLSVSTDVWSLWISPSDSDTWLAGFVGKGIYRTTDAGESWEPVMVTAVEQVQVNELLSHPGGEGWVLAASPHQSGTLYLGGIESNLYGSEDFGVTVESLSFPAQDTLITGIVVDPQQEGGIYVAMAGMDALISPDTTLVWTKK